MTDLRLALDFVDHPKAVKLRRRLGAEAVLSLLRLWAFAAQRHPDGLLAGVDDDDLEIAARWSDERAGELVPVLVELGFLEGPPQSRALHDWEEHQPWVSTAPQRTARARAAARARWGGAEEDERASPSDAGRMRNACTEHAPSMPLASEPDAPSMPPDACSNAPLLTSPLLSRRDAREGVRAADALPEAEVIELRPETPPSPAALQRLDGVGLQVADGRWQPVDWSLLEARYPSLDLAEVLRGDELARLAARWPRRLADRQLRRHLDRLVDRQRQRPAAPLHERLTREAQEAIDAGAPNAGPLAAAAVLQGYAPRTPEATARVVAWELGQIELEGGPPSRDDLVRAVRAYAGTLARDAEVRPADVRVGVLRWLRERQERAQDAAVKLEAGWTEESRERALEGLAAAKAAAFGRRGGGATCSS